MPLLHQKQDKRFSSPFDNYDTQIDIIMAEKKDIDSALFTDQLPVARPNKSIITSQKSGLLLT